MKRRGFLGLLGIGAAAAVTKPVKERIGAATEAITSAQVEEPTYTHAEFNEKISVNGDPITDYSITGHNPFLDYSAGAGRSGSLSDLLRGVDGETIDIIWGPDLEFKNDLKADRTAIHSEYPFCKDTINKGSIVSYCEEGCVKKQIGSEPPAGIITNDVVNVDLPCMRYYEPRTLLGGKVCVIKKGTVVTKVAGDPKPGTVAYASNGTINDEVGVRVGTFLTRKDFDGFARVNIDV